MVAEIADSVRAAARLNHTPTVMRRRCAGAGGYLNGRSAGAGLGADDVWVANGSNEVMTHLLQAFGGPAGSC